MNGGYVNTLAKFYLLLVIYQTRSKYGEKLNFYFRDIIKQNYNISSINTPNISVKKDQRG